MFRQDPGDTCMTHLARIGGQCEKFNCKIELDPSSPPGLGGLPNLAGRILIDSKFCLIRCDGLVVQLHLQICFRFENRQGQGCLQSESGDRIEMCISELERLTGSTDRSPALVPIDLIKDGQYSAIFNLNSHYNKYTQDQEDESGMLTPFNNQFGYIQYKLVVLMKSKGKCVQIAEKVLNFNGYRNLRQLPSKYCVGPLKHEAGLRKSVFSSKKVIHANLTVQNGGYLPNEEIPFTLTILNQESLTIRDISVTLIRRSVYNCPYGERKCTLTTLDCFNGLDGVKKDEEIIYTGKLKVPRNCVPSAGLNIRIQIVDISGEISYKSKPLFSVTHLIQYEVKVTEYGGIVRGELEIIIGTTRKPMTVSISGPDPHLPSQPSEATRQSDRHGRSSSIANAPTLFTGSIVSLPTYSQLPSRAMSMLSVTTFDTLPPNYEDLQGAHGFT